MVTVQEFRSLLIDAEPLHIVDSILLAHPPAHLPPERVTYIASSLAAAYGIHKDNVNVIVTGSAHLGFSLVEKQRKGEPLLPRYRPYSADSDVDVAIISEPIFDMIWHELATYFDRATHFPPDTKRLGDYLVCGWLRPDHFPRQVRLPVCDNWSKTFYRLSSNRIFQRRKINGGIFHSLYHLRQYMSRAVRDCIQKEVLP